MKVGQLTLAAGLALGLFSLTPGASAQQKSLKDQLVGTWILVEAVDVHPDGKKDNPWGSNPLGTYIFNPDGHFAQMLIRSDLPKMANRNQGTPDQYKAIVQGSIAYFGTYSVNEAEKAINFHFDGSTFAGFIGTNGKRTITSITADELKVSNPTTSTGLRADSVWRRAK